MAKNGGYIIIDFGDTPLTADEGGTIPDIYEDFEHSGRKAVLISGITLDGVEHKDVFVDVTIEDSSFKFTAYGKTFTITKGETPEADKVTIS